MVRHVLISDNGVTPRSCSFPKVHLSYVSSVSSSSQIMDLISDEYWGGFLPIFVWNFTGLTRRLLYSWFYFGTWVSSLYYCRSWTVTLLIITSHRLFFKFLYGFSSLYIRFYYSFLLSLTDLYCFYCLDHLFLQFCL